MGVELGGCPDRVGAFGERVGVDRDSVPMTGQQHDISAITGRERERALVEGLAQTGNALPETFAAAQKIGNEQAILAQTGATGLEKRQRVERPGTSIRVVAVDHDPVEMAVTAEDEVGPAAIDDLQPCGVVRQFEVLAGDKFDLRVDLHHGDLRCRQMAIAEFGQRTTAQADLKDATRLAGRRVEQQPGHHVSRVFQFERPGTGDAHGTLHPVRAEVQAANAIFLADVDGVAGGCGATGHDRAVYG